MPKILDKNGRPLEPVMAEIASPNRSDLYRYWLGKLQANPDPILRNKAGSRGMEFFEDMLLTDPVLASLFQTRVNGILSCKRTVVAASDEPRDEEIREFVQDTFDRLENFDQDLRELCDAIPKGFAVSEIMWAPDRDGRIGIEKILSRNQSHFHFERDTNALMFLSNPYTTQGEAVPERKFLIHTFDPRHENPFGSPVLSRCYWAYFFKKHSIKWWSIFNEKFGQPTVIGKYPRGLATSDQTTLRDIIEAIKVETGITIPDDVAIELLEANATGNISSHEKFTALMDTWMTKAVLGSTLTTDVGQYGTQALGTVHSQIRSEYVEADSKSLMAVVNHQLIPALVDWNFPGVEDYPRMVIDTSPGEDLQAAANTLKVVVKEMGLPVGKKFLYEKFGIPEPKDDEELLETPKAPDPFALAAAASAGPADEDGSDRSIPSIKSKSSQKQIPPEEEEAETLGERARYKTFAEISADLSPAMKARARRAVQHPEEITQMARIEARKVYQGWIDEALARITKGVSGKLDSAAQERAFDLDTQLDEQPLADLIQASMLYAMLQGRSDVREDAESAKPGLKFEAPDPQTEKFAEWPPAFMQAINFLLRKEPKSRKEYDRLSPVQQAKSFTAKVASAAARVARRDAVRDIQNLTISAVRDGLDLENFTHYVNEALDMKGITPLSDWHIETIFRTNVQDAYNAGRWEMFNDPDVSGMIVAYQYVAVEDDRTRPEHLAMNGKVFAKDDPIWSQWWPPNGFNCRCTVLPIFQGEEWSGSEKPPEDVTPDDGFARNSAELQRAA